MSLRYESGIVRVTGSSVFPRLRLGKHRDSRKNKTKYFPREETLSVYYFKFYFTIVMLFLADLNLEINWKRTIDL
jgi:hypothetical protein